MMYSQLVNTALPAAVSELVPNQLFPPAMVPGRELVFQTLARLVYQCQQKETETYWPEHMLFGVGEGSLEVLLDNLNKTQMDSKWKL